MGLNNGWLLNGKQIVSDKAGKEKNLEFLNKFDQTTPETLSNLAIEKTYSKNDVRNSVIAYIKFGMKCPLWVNR